MGRNTIEIWTTLPFPYLLILVKAVQVEKFSLSDMQNLRTALLTHWLPIISILFLREAIYINIFRCNYLGKKKYYLNFFWNFRNLDSILNIFKKNMILIADIFWTYGVWKTWIDQSLKSPVSEDPSTSYMVKWSKHCSKLNGSIFTIFIDHCECNSGWKTLSESYAKC